MRFRTHLAFGVFLHFLLEPYFHGSFLLFYWTVLLSVAPDIDLHTSTMGRKIKPLSYFFTFILGHRGFLHSLWVVAIIFPFFWYYGLGLAVLGYASHLFLDALTKKGISFFWPYMTIKGPLISGGLVDSILFFVLVVMDGIFFLTLL